MRNDGVTFSIARHAYWAPGLTTPEAWEQWAQSAQSAQPAQSAQTPVAATTLAEDGPGAEPGVEAMPPMLRRRAGFFGKMALEVAYQCLDGRTDVPVVFCSRHGEVARALALLTDLARAEPLSPTGFSMSVHNANVGLLTIARKDRANHIALAAGAATIETAVIEACGLLADGAASVLLVACEAPLPALFVPFLAVQEQAYAWAWLLTAPAADPVALRWQASADAETTALPNGLAAAHFHLGGAAAMARCDGRLRWQWSRAGVGAVPVAATQASGGADVAAVAGAAVSGVAVDA